MLSFPLKYGDPQTALSQPYSMILNQELASKYFGDENPLGKSLRVNNQYEFTITGVLEKLPENSSLTFNGLISFDFTRTTGQFDGESVIISILVVIPASWYCLKQ